MRRCVASSRVWCRTEPAWAEWHWSRRGRHRSSSSSWVTPWPVALAALSLQDRAGDPGLLLPGLHERLGVLVPVAVAEPAHPWVVCFIAPLGHDVHVLVRRAERVQAARVRGICVIDVAAPVLVEHGEARQL